MAQLGIGFVGLGVVLALVAFLDIDIKAFGIEIGADRHRARRMGGVGVVLIIVGALLLWVDSRADDTDEVADDAPGGSAEADQEDQESTSQEESQTEDSAETVDDTDPADTTPPGPLPDTIDHDDACAALQAGSTTNFREADLAGCVLTSEVNLRNTIFVDADLSGAELAVGGIREDLNFDGADLTGATLAFATFENPTFIGATLVDATIRNANLVNADFEGADVSGLLLREIPECRDASADPAPMFFFDNVGLPALIDVPSDCVQEGATAEPCNAVAFALAANVYLAESDLDDQWRDDDFDCLSNGFERNSEGSPADQPTVISPIPEIRTQIRDGRG
ncbi:MAG: pentapeptide repeat-containing protein [Actinomycetota bacterium]